MECSPQLRSPIIVPFKKSPHIKIQWIKIPQQNSTVVLFCVFFVGVRPCEKSPNDGISERPFSSVGFCRRFPRQKSTGWNMQAGFVKRNAKITLPGTF